MVTELVKSENSYQSAFHTVRELSPTVAWLELVRSSAMDRFEQLGFPPVTDEEWKYTNLASLDALCISRNCGCASRRRKWFLA